MYHQQSFAKGGEGGERKRFCRKAGGECAESCESGVDVIDAKCIIGDNVCCPARKFFLIWLNAFWLFNPVMINWRSPRVSELTSIFDTGLTHLGSEASN